MNRPSINSNCISFVSMEKVGILNQSFETPRSVFDFDLMHFSKKTSEEVFSPSYVFFDNGYYFLKENLNCKLYKEDNLFFVECPALKIKVWGASKADAINAFNFAFHALVENYVKEDDSKLSLGARRLKNKLKSIIA